MSPIEVEERVAPRRLARLRRPARPSSSSSVEKSSPAIVAGGQLRDLHAAERNLRERPAAIGDRHVEPVRRHRLGQDLGALQMADAEQMLDIEEHAPRHDRGSSGMLSSATDGVPSGATAKACARPSSSFCGGLPVIVQPVASA